MEVDGGFEILDIPEATGSSLDGHDLAVQSLGNPVGDRVFAVGQNIFEPLMDHGADPFDWSNWHRSTHFFHEAKNCFAQWTLL